VGAFSCGREKERECELAIERVFEFVSKLSRECVHVCARVRVCGRISWREIESERARLGPATFQ